MSNEFRAGLLAEVDAERARQDEKWGGPEHDAHHEPAEWAEFIAAYNGWALMMARMDSPQKYRRRLIQIAALALAAAEALDRRYDAEATAHGVSAACVPE